MINSLKTLNQHFKHQCSQLFQTNSLQKFEIESGISFFDCITAVLSLKNKKQKSLDQSLRNIIRAISQITSLTKDEISFNLVSTKRTVVSKFLSQILISQDSGREFVERKRIETLQKLKKQQEIGSADKNLFQVMIKIFLPNQLKGKELKWSQQSFTENAKLLISLKRSMVLEPLLKFNKKLDHIRKDQSKKSYNINTDIKAIFQKIVDKYDGVPEIQKLKELMLKVGNKKWLGPRMYKLLSQQNWSLGELELLKRILIEQNVNFKSYKSDSALLRTAFTKIKRNLRRYISTQKIGKLQLVSNFDMDQEKLTLFELQLLPSNTQSRLSYNFSESDLHKSFSTLQER